MRKERKFISKEINDLVIRMYDSGNYNIKKIADSLSLNRKTVSKLITAKQNGIAFKTAAEKKKETHKNINNTFNAIDQSVYNSVICNNSIVQSEIASIVQEAHNISISQPSISRKLKNMKITRKRLNLVPVERNTQARIQERLQYAIDISRINDENLVFLDETGFNQHTRRKYGYSLENTKAYICVPANRNLNKSLMCVINHSGIVAYKYKNNAFKSQEFCEFISEKLVPYFAENPSKILIMDNARFHKSAQVLRILSENNIAFKFLVPYSPELNPIEEFFSMLKSKFHTLRSNTCDITIEECLDDLLHPSKNYSIQCTGFYRNMREWLEKAMRQEEFI